MHFDSYKRQFSFKNRFTSREDLIQKMYTERMGVPENDDLWDDLYEQRKEIEFLRKEGKVFRAINTEKKPNKPEQIVLFVKNYAGDEVDAREIEGLSSAFLRRQWRETEDLSFALKFSSATGEGGRRGKNGLEKNGKKRGGARQDYNPHLDRWSNNHLQFKIEKALKEIRDITVVHNKTGFKKVKS